MDCQYHSRPHRLDTSRFDVTGLELLDFVIPPISELTCQPGRGILRAMDRAGSGAVKTGPSEPGNNRTVGLGTLWNESCDC